jgi:pumilio family protein 6
MLHDAIVSDAAQPKTEDIEHAFENFFSSRVIRRMIIDCPAFAVTLWRKALEGKCKIWAEGHRYYVLLQCDAILPCTRASKTHAVQM